MTQTMAHDPLVGMTQLVYRRLMDCMARPGQIADLDDECLGPILVITSRREAMAVALTLIDNEVSFNVCNDWDAAFSGLVRFQTGGVLAGLADADFVFMNGDSDPETIRETKRGTLNFPDQGATVIISGLDIQAELDGQSRAFLELEGPGIQDRETLTVGGLSEEIVRALIEVNEEYPLGIDLILLSEGRMACIPRSTKIRVKGGF